MFFFFFFLNVQILTGMISSKEKLFVYPGDHFVKPITP